MESRKDRDRRRSGGVIVCISDRFEWMVREENTSLDAYKTINDTLVYLFNEIWELEEKAIITEEFRDITNNDMHIIEAIGLGEDSTMSAVAKKLGITAGSLTTSMNSLVNKKYVIRQRSESDRRVVYIQLTAKGKKAYEHHKNFHMQMTNAVIADLDEKELKILLQTLDKLSVFFRGYQERVQEKV